MDSSPGSESPGSGSLIGGKVEGQIQNHVWAGITERFSLCVIPQVLVLLGYFPIQDAAGFPENRRTTYRTRCASNPSDSTPARSPGLHLYPMPKYSHKPLLRTSSRRLIIVDIAVVGIWETMTDSLPPFAFSPH